MQSSASSSEKMDNSDFSLLRKLFQKISNHRDQAIILFFLETGRTVSDLITLKTTDFEFESCSISIKGHRQKISLELSLLLRKISGLYHVFATKKGMKLSNVRVLQIVNFWSFQLLGKKLCPKDLRHSAELTSCIMPSREREYLSEEQEVRLSNVISDEVHGMMLSIMLETGCTGKELAMLRADEFNNNHLEFSIGSKNRVARISSELSLKIHSHISKNKGDYIFYSRQGTFSDKRIFQIFRQYGQKAGIGSVSPRVFRATCVARMKKRTSEMDIKRQIGIKHLSRQHFGVLVIKE